MLTIKLPAEKKEWAAIKLWYRSIVAIFGNWTTIVSKWKRIALKFSIPQSTHSAWLDFNRSRCAFQFFFFSSHFNGTVEIIELGKFHSKFASWRWKIHSIHWAYFPAVCIMPYRKCIRHDELEFFWMVGYMLWMLKHVAALFRSLFKESKHFSSATIIRQQTGFYSTREHFFDEQLLFIRTCEFQTNSTTETL